MEWTRESEAGGEGLPEARALRVCWRLAVAQGEGVPVEAVELLPLRETVAEGSDVKDAVRSAV